MSTILSNRPEPGERRNPEMTPIRITHADLKAMRDAGNLTPGQLYRITDYVTTSMSVNTRSAGHPFDILVHAINEKTLSEQAWAVKHDGDTYFEDARLEAWELKYRLDNVQWSQRVGTLIEDENDGYTALSIGTVDIDGEMYILWDASEFEEDYGFTRMVSLTKDVGAEMWTYDPATGEKGEDVQTSIAAIVAEYTEAGKGTITWMKDEHGNECPYDFKNMQFKRWMTTDSVSGREELGGKYMVADPDNCPIGLSVEDTEDFIWAYTFSSDNAGGEQTDYSLTDEHQVHDNTMKANGSELNNITFFGNNCYSMSFGNGCYGMSFGNNCYSMSFGNWNYGMSFGNSNSDMSFGDSCYSMSFGNSNHDTSFGNGCSGMSFGNGNYGMSFGNFCYNMSFGNSNRSMSFGNSNCDMSFGNDCRNGTITEGVQYVDIPANTWNFQLLNGLAGTSNSHLVPSFATQKAYTQVACKNSSGQLKIYVPGDLV